MTDDPEIDYEALTQEAMRGVMRAVLVRVATDGLPGDHHFYVAFNTRAAGVGLSRRLREKYPDEMTIVLQHRFWDLAVRDDRFEVKLTFDGIPELLSIPFAAVKVFFDPSVQYGLQFDDKDTSSIDPSRRSMGARRMSQPENSDNETVSTSPRLPGRAPSIDKKRPARKSRAERSTEASPEAAPSQASPASPTGNQPTPLRPAAVISGATPITDRAGKGAGKNVLPPKEADDDDDSENAADATEHRQASEPITKPETPGAKIVNIENFRKK